MRSIVAIIFAVLSTGALAAPPSTAPSPLFVKAAAAVERNQMAQFATEMDDAAQWLLDVWATSDHAALFEHAVFREFARSFARIKALNPDQTDTLRWLLDQPILLRTLMLAQSESDPPDRVLEVLAALRSHDAERAARNPALVTALCVVWDDHERSRVPEEAPLDADRIVRLFDLYTTQAGRLAYAPESLPVELLAFVVGNPVSDDEIAWARREYATEPDVADAYFDITYRWPDLDRALPPDDPRAYTLWNIRRAGGLCTEQAHYASAVGQAIGIPTVACTGGNGFGEPRAWVAWLRRTRGGGEWIHVQYPEHRQILGQLVDPQSGRTINGGDLLLVADVARVSVDQRALSTSIVKLADAMPPDARLDLIEQAITIWPGNRAAWDRLASLVAREQIPVDQVDRARSLALRELLPNAPGAAYTVLRWIIEGQPENAQVERLDELAEAFAEAPPVLSLLRIEQIDLLRTDRRDDEALALAEELLASPDALGPDVVPVLARVEEMLRERDEIGRLADVYANVWESLPRCRPGPHAGTLPYVAVGRRYAEVLKEIGEDARANNVSQRVESLVVNVRR